MEFPFNIAASIGVPESAGPQVGRVDEHMLAGPRGGKLCEVLDAMGKRSATAQGLKKPVTIGTPYQSGQRIYLLADARTALGILKVGTKRLYVAPPASAKQSDARENLVEINPVCALDFYVHESCQRGGFGRKLFDTMLQHEGLRPAKLAYDRPSSKFTGFLRKHFGLSSFTPQNNNFVVFDQFFKGEAEQRGTSRERSSDAMNGRGGILPGCGQMGRSAVPSESRPPPLPTPQQQQLPPRHVQQQVADCDAHSASLLQSQLPPQLLPPSAQVWSATPSQGPIGGGPLGAVGCSGGGMPPRDDGRASRSGLMPTPWGTDRDGRERDLRNRPRGGLASTGSSCGRAPSADLLGSAVSVPAGMLSGGRPPRSSSLPSSRSGHSGSSNRFASPLSHAGQRMVRS